jgi:hypothetical protein
LHIEASKIVVNSRKKLGFIDEGIEGIFYMSTTAVIQFETPLEGFLGLYRCLAAKHRHK